MLLIPDSWGGELLGDSWEGVRGVLLASVIGQTGNLLSVGPACVAYGMGRSDAVFRIHAAVSVMLVVFGLGGLWLGGAEGTAYGFALAYWAVIPVWFRTVARLQWPEREAVETDAVLAGEGKPARGDVGA